MEPMELVWIHPWFQIFGKTELQIFFINSIGGWATTNLDEQPPPLLN